MKTHIFTIFLCLSFAAETNSNSPSQDTSQLSIADVVHHTLLHNKQIQATYHDHLATQKAKWEAISSYLPQANFNADYSTIESDRFTSPFVSAGFAGDIFANKFQISQLIFDRSVLGNISIAELREEGAQLQWQGQQQEAVLHSISIFFEILRSQEIIEVQNQRIKLAEEQLYTTTTQFEVGYRTHTEVSQAKLTKAAATRDANVARLAKERAQIALNRTMGMSVEHDYEFQSTYLTEFSPIDHFDSLPEGKELYQTAQQQNPALRIANNLVHQYEESIKTAKGEYLPRITSSGSWGFNDTGSLDLQEEEWMLQLNIQIPLLEGGRRVAKVGRTKEQYLAEMKRYEQTLLEVQSHLKEALTIMKEEQANYELAIYAEEVGQSNYQDKYTLYQEGMIEQIEVIQALTDLVDAQKDVVIARYNFLQGLLQFQASMGTIPISATHYQNDHWLTTVPEEFHQYPFKR